MPTTAHNAAFSFVEQLAQDLQDARFELPAFPEAVLRIQRAMQSSDTTAGDLVRIMSSDPGLAAKVLRIANSAAFRPATGEITDLQNAVSRLGFNTIRTVAVTFAMRQLRHNDLRSPAARAEIETIWRDSLQIAAVCYVLARHYTRINADHALLTGLLHALGRLYIVMRAEEMTDMSEIDIREIADGWQASIGKAILESWGLPEPLQHAVEHQDDLDAEMRKADETGEGETAGAVSLTDILVAAKVLTLQGGAPEAGAVPALRRLSEVKDKDASAVLTDYEEEIQELRLSLGE